jgi:hypothetical protein
VPALVTLCAEVFWSEATFWPDASGSVVADEAWRVKAVRAELVMSPGRPAGHRRPAHVRSNIPPRWGSAPRPAT